MVEHILRIKAERNPLPFHNLDGFPEIHVRVPDHGTGQVVAREVAPLPWQGVGENIFSGFVVLEGSQAAPEIETSIPYYAGITALRIQDI